MNIVFFGSDSFAKRLFENCLNRALKPCAIVTKEGTSKGSNRKKTKTPVKKWIDESSLHIPHFCPMKASSPEFIEKIKSLLPDIFVVCGYGEIISQKLLDVPSITCINIHPSDLPKYRGATPIQSSLINGEKNTAVCIMQMVLKMDAGPIYKRLFLDIQLEDNYLSLEKKLTQLCTEPLIALLEQFSRGDAVEKMEQDESHVTFCKRIFPVDCQINWNNDALTLHNLIRATSSRPGAWCVLKIKDQMKKCKILKAKPHSCPSTANPGTILEFDSKGRFLVQCQKGSLEVLELQLEAKRVMQAREFMNGVDSIAFVLNN